jgi:hypothetical protein
VPASAGEQHLRRVFDLEASSAGLAAYLTVRAFAVTRFQATLGAKVQATLIATRLGIDMILDLVTEMELEFDATNAAERCICRHALGPVVIEVLKTTGGSGPNLRGMSGQKSC